MTSPKLFEALMQQPNFKKEIAATIERARMNPFTGKFCQLGLKEGILSDMAGALGRMHDAVIEAAKPNLIAREIIWVRPTTEAMVRFPKAKKSKAYVVAESGEVFKVGEKYETVDISTNVLIRHGAEWTREFIEDATWPVMERQMEEAGRATADLETEKVLALYNGIANADLAGGAPLAGGGTAMDWGKVTALWDAVQNENFSAKVLVLHPRQVTQLWRDDKFIHGFYFGEKADVARGVLGDTYLGMKIVKSTKVVNGTAFAIDTDVAAVMLLRRDIMTEPYENPQTNLYGLVASERVGLGVLRSKAVAKMTNIATAL